jgi:ATP-dependent DNA helicase RecQ
VGAALRILERHGLLAVDGDTWVATRPEPGTYPPLDVEALARRAEGERGKLRAMVDYAWSPRCRRQVMLAYFGDAEWRDPDRTCGACDVCDAVARGDTGVDDELRGAVVELLGLVGALRGRFGRTRVVALATGADDDPRFEELPERGCLRGWSQKDLLDLLRSLEGAALLEVSRGEYPTVALTRRGEQVAAGTIAVDALGLRLTPRSAAARTKRPRARRRAPR